MANRIIKGDTVKIIAGANKGTTGKVLSVVPGKNAAVIEGVGMSHRHVSANRLNPTGGKRDIHVPVELSKLALVTDEKTAKTSRVGFIKNADGKKTRVARQQKNKEIK